MTLRAKFALAFGAVAAITIAVTVALSFGAASALVKINTEQTFRALVDSVAERTRQTSLTPSAFDAPEDDSSDDSSDDNSAERTLMNSRQVIVQVLGPDGSAVVRDADRVTLPIGDGDRALAARARAGAQQERWFVENGEEYQLVTVSLGGGRGAVQIGQRGVEDGHLLKGLGQLLLVIGLGVFVLAGAAGWLVTGRVTRRLAGLTATVERVASSARLDTPVPVHGRDEVGRLGLAFDTMLGRLARARDDQRRLIQDAGHELKTPLTSLRTNVSVLRRFGELAADDRRRLVDDLESETRELSQLVGELVELSTEQHVREEPRPVVLGELVERVAARARRRTGRTIVVSAADVTVVARAVALDRALSNLVDNAAKFAADDAEPIEIVAAPDRFAVLDRGPGIPREDVERIFDRFYRAASARSMPGSGLGLAIVREVATAHGGTVFAADRPGGGAVVGFTISPDSYA